jgi:hypothetical protein
MSETASKSKGLDTEVLVVALDAIQEEQQEQTTILQHLEQRKIVELDGVERRLDELADALGQITMRRMPRLMSRRWWIVPLWIGIALLALPSGMVLGWMTDHSVLRSRVMAMLFPHPLVQTLPVKGKR